MRIPRWARILGAVCVGVFPVVTIAQRDRQTPQPTVDATVVPQVEWAVRRVRPADVNDIADIMTRFTQFLCTRNGVACTGEWDTAWASGEIAAHPNSFVITRNGITVSFFHVPHVDVNATTPETIDGVTYGASEVAQGGILGVRVGSSALPNNEVRLVLLRTFRLGMEVMRRMGYKVLVSQSPWVDLGFAERVDQDSFDGSLRPVRSYTLNGIPMLTLRTTIDDTTDGKLLSREMAEGSIVLDDPHL